MQKHLKYIMMGNFLFWVNNFHFEIWFLKTIGNNSKTMKDLKVYCYNMILNNSRIDYCQKVGMYSVALNKKTRMTTSIDEWSKGVTVDVNW